MASTPGLGQNGELDAEHALDATRTCDGCRNVLAVHVVGKGSARYTHGAAAEARLIAKENARKDALLLSGFAPCPRCGKREGRAVRAVALHAGLRLGLAAALLALGSGLDAQIHGPFLFIACVGAWCLLIAAVAPNIRRLIGARKRVTIEVVDVRVVAVPVVVKNQQLEMQ